MVFKKRVGRGKVQKTKKGLFITTTTKSGFKGRFKPKKKKEVF